MYNQMQSQKRLKNGNKIIVRILKRESKTQKKFFFLKKDKS
jgi:hypothetical protein